MGASNTDAERQKNLAEGAGVLIIPPAFPTAKPHPGHAVYLSRIDCVHRNRVSHQNNKGLTIGYDCHGIPVKCKVSDLNLAGNELSIAKRYTVQAIKQFEALIDKLDLSKGARWSTADIDYQLLVDEFIEKSKAKGLLINKKGINIDLQISN